MRERFSISAIRKWWNLGEKRSTAVTFLVCLVVATFIWVLMTFSEKYTGTITFKVVYENVPEGLMLLSGNEQEIVASIEDAGFGLAYDQIFKDGDELAVDLSKDLEYLGGSIAINDLRKTIQNELDGAAILNLQPDSLYFTLSGIVNHEVPLVPNYISQFDTAQYRVIAVACSPPYVTVNGPELLLNNLLEIQTEKVSVQLAGQVSNLTIPAELILEDERYTSSQEDCEIIFEVETKKVYTFSIPADYSGIKMKLDSSLKINPTVSFEAFDSDYAKLSPSDFGCRAYLDSTGVVAETGDALIYFELLKMPDGVSGVSLVE